ncbi:MAG TPA: MFS transporter [Pseudonocardiaceae bacterium]
MNVRPYRAVLAIPGVTRLTVVALLARIPVTSAGVVLTLHVVLTLGHGYAAAGLVGTASTIGAAFGAPLLGRLVDRHGLRRVLVLATVAEALFWGVAPWLPYPALLVAAFAGGVLALPVFTVVRQALAALVPAEQRRTAYSVDSMSVEVSFMIGPVLGVLAATQVSTTAAMLGIGIYLLASGASLYLLNPPMRGEATDGTARLAVRSWLRPALVSVLVATAACTIVLAGTDVAIVAALRSTGAVSLTGLVFALWGLASVIGGFIYGALHRGINGLVLAVALGVCTIPVGLFGSAWWVLCVALLPAGMLCAPTLAALADTVSRLAPETVRGLVMGLHSSALTVGLAVGAPLSGAVVDASSYPWAFAATGGAGALLALGALLVQRRAEPAAPMAPPEAEPAVPSGPEPAEPPFRAQPVASSAATASAIS